MGNQQPSSEQEKAQRLFPWGSRIASVWQFEVVDIRKDEDIVCTIWKHIEIRVYRRKVAICV